jgi:hypothetical protein
VGRAVRNASIPQPTLITNTYPSASCFPLLVIAPTPDMTSLPTTRAHAFHHEEDFQAAAKTIDQAIDRALGSSMKYDKVGVISLLLENDEARHRF